MNYCQACGANLSESSKFCHKCGIKILDSNLESFNQDNLSPICKEHDFLPFRTPDGMRMCKKCLGKFLDTELKYVGSDSGERLNTIQMQGTINEKNIVADFHQEKGPDIFKVFALFLGFAIVVVIFITAIGNSDKVSSTGAASATRVIDYVGENDGPRDYYLNQPLGGALDTSALTLARSQGLDLLGDCSNIYTVRLGANCIYGHWMALIGENSPVTVNSIKEQLTPGFSMPLILHNLFPSQVYFDSVSNQLVWLAERDEKKGITYSQYR
jgi:hypothetical protein